VTDVKVRMSGRQFATLRAHLFPGDGNEAVAVALCGRRADEGAGHVLCVRRVEQIPHALCSVREPDRVTWLVGLIRPLLDEAARRGMAVVKFHSHSQGYPAFSRQDDRSDQELFGAVGSWLDSTAPHASVVLLPDGNLFGRSVTPDGTFAALDSIAVVGENLRFWFAACPSNGDVPEFARRHAQAFGPGTTALLRRLAVAVVGCSGTGSPVVEQLVRLGVGRLVLVDFDVVEEKNLNRIPHAAMADALAKRPKVEVVAEAVRRAGLGTRVEPILSNLLNPDAVRRVAGCDVAFGCMDSAEGRHLLNRLAVFYSLPYIDVGVRLEADGAGGISQICGTVHYLQPDGSSLLSRGAITMDAVQAEGLRRTDPVAYREQVASKYITGVREERPAVVSVNMHYASLAVLEMLARLHDFRVDGNGPFAQFGSSLTDPRFEPVGADGEPCPVLSKHLGRGDVTPLLENPYLG
jgi:hypothetical protein